MVDKLKIINSSSRPFRFIVAGVINTLIDWGILNVLLLVTYQQTIQTYALFKSISFACAVAASYILNRHFVFKSQAKFSFGELASFVFVSIIGWTLNTSIATFTTFSIALPLFWMRANIGAILGTCVGLLWNYFGYARMVFKSKTLIS